jgi:hypothetical protein
MPKRSSETVYRRSLRLQGYDYAQAGAYFVTICTQNRACLFGEAADGTTRMNPAGSVMWLAHSNHYSPSNTFKA